MASDRGAHGNDSLVSGERRAGVAGRNCGEQHARLPHALSQRHHDDRGRREVLRRDADADRGRASRGGTGSRETDRGSPRGIHPSRSRVSPPRRIHRIGVLRRSFARERRDEAWPIVQETQKQMIELAREIGAKHNWPLPSDGNAAVRTVFDKLGEDYPKSDAEMMGWYRDAAFRLVDYARKTGLFDVPAE